MRHAIGAGALGPVFRAYEADADRDVAVKLFRLDLPPERVHELVDQLNRLIAAGVSHASLITPVAAGISGARAYLVEELVDGESLDVVLRDRGAASPGDALRLISQAAGALDAGASRGLLHGALHPRDVLGADTEVVRLTGIGVAQALEAVAAAVPVRRPYASPERVTGVRWDRRADVFSLAAIAHEVLWGRRVVGVGEQVAVAIPEVEGIDMASLRRVFAQALAPSPGDRFETAGAFAATLGECFEAVGRAALRAAAPRRPARSESRPTPQRTPVVARADTRLPLDEPALVEPPVPTPPRRVVPEAADPPSEPADLPLLSPPAPPVVLRVGREHAFDPPLAPVRLDTGDGGATQENRDGVGRRYRGAERAAALLSPPERPLPLPSPDDPHRSAISSLVFTAVVFLALGFAGGYWVASWAQPAQRPLVVSAPPRAAEPPPAAAVVQDPMPAAPLASEPSLPEAGLPAPAALPPATGPSTRTEAAAPEPPPAVIEDPPAPRAVAAQVLVPRAAPRPAAPASPGVLHVDSRPPGANVFVDGRLRGRTPLQLDGVPAGEHGVRLQLDGYREWLTAVQVASGGRQRVAASLEPRN